MAPINTFKRKEAVEDEFFIVKRFRYKNQMKNEKANSTPRRRISGKIYGLTIALLANF